MFLNCCSDGIDGLHDFARDFGIRNFQSEVFFQGDDQLQGVNRIQSEAMWAEQWLVIPNFRRTDFEHAIFNHHFFDLGFKFDWIIHWK